MGHIEIAAVDHRLRLIQLHQIVPQIVLPLHAVVQPGQLVLGVGRVAAHQIEFRVFRRNDPSLVAVDLLAEVIGNREGRLPGKHGGAGIARLVGAVPVAFIARQVEFRLFRAHLRLLQADHICVRKGAEVQKALAETGPQAVDVPRYQFHRGSFPAARSRRRFLTVFPHFTRFSTGNQLALFGEKEYSKIKMIRGVSWGRKAESGI